MSLPVIPAIPAGNFSASAAADTSKTLQSAAALTADGAVFNISGMSTVVFTVSTTGFSGSVTFEGSSDGTIYSNILATELGTTTVATGMSGLSTDTSTTVWRADIAGLTYVKAPIVRSAGSITVSAYASPSMNAEPVGSTIGTAVIQANTGVALPVGNGAGTTALRVAVSNDNTGVIGLNAGTNVIGKTLIESVSGTALAADMTNSELCVSNYIKTTNAGDTSMVAGHGTAAAALRVELPTDGTGVVGLNTGTNTIGGVNLVDKNGTNKAIIGADGAQLVSDGGTTYVAVIASSAAAITSAKRACRALVTSTVTSAVSVYDNTSQASGAIVGIIPTTTAVGATVNLQAPLTSGGFYVAGGTGSPALTVFYI